MIASRAMIYGISYSPSLFLKALAIGLLGISSPAKVNEATLKDIGQCITQIHKEQCMQPVYNKMKHNLTKTYEYFMGLAVIHQ